jgi:hypothetical protein
MTPSARRGEGWGIGAVARLLPLAGTGNPAPDRKPTCRSPGATEDRERPWPTTQSCCYIDNSYGSAYLPR